MSISNVNVDGIFRGRLMMNVTCFNPKVYSLPLTINDFCHLLGEINGGKNHRAKQKTSF